MVEGVRDDGQTAISGANSSKVRIVGVTVRVRSGPDEGRSCRVETPSFVIGSGSEVDFRLTDEAVSRTHLRLAPGPDGVHVRDESSRNGTWLGGVQIRNAVLTGDVTLTVGSTVLTVTLDTKAHELRVSTRTHFGDAIGASLPMRHVFSVLERAARSDISILLEGETGVGKDVLARAIHLESPRKDGPFVVVDCGSIPGNLIESELFGHTRGAFTGATQNKEGVFVEAHGGTIFLDELGELPIDMQPRLLRTIEQREVRPVGGGATHKLDVRIVAATNRSLSEAVEAGAFRKDLFFRLAVGRVFVPPLRDRPEDVIPLALGIFRGLVSDPNASLPHDLAALLPGYSWPGNVRELRNVVERYAFMGMRERDQLLDANASGTSDPLDALPFHEARRRVLEEFERGYFVKLLERSNGVVARAAQLAEIGRPSLYRILERLGLRNE